MTFELSARARLTLTATAIALVTGGAGYGIATFGDDDPATETAQGGREVLYWYDPMVPNQHFDKPGKSPFMDMQLVPKYADEAGEGAGVRIDPALVQNLGLRTAEARLGSIGGGVTATGTIGYNERDVAIIQPRAGGFVQRTYGRAPDDVIAAGAPLADLLIPDWGGAQQEYLAVLRTGDKALASAARQRLVLLGMPQSTIAAVERTGRPRTIITIASPISGTIKSLSVRPGMSVAAGQTLAEVNGLGTVWLDAAVPEAMAAQVRPGALASATLTAFPGETFRGRVRAIVPQADTESRTITARIELPNRGGRLRPGMYATVAFGGEARSALLIPSEAVIRTGKRSLVMLALDKGRYRPAEVRTGIEADGRTEVLVGLAEGEKVVTSGQFLIDSEASLSGMDVRPVDGVSSQVKPKAATHEATGRIEKITPKSITLSHGPVPALDWPPMTMMFRLEEPSLARGFKTGDRVRFTFDQPREGATVRSIARENGQ
ncbi:efflux RND transporter periplasmic adaptor subunit [Novosphingobium mathurense]|uniref:Membrane fusion protein, Cu(I)/Ag(I) efflux system n=1 Tax=Novosphingobium mathurense TaxID=428990 RepID=A0A1U6ID40_9SPHN|nr:efflux RND transporter periplasmic adaptor subunit [Novosphingobium mathurense]SLK05938.1 membrane fusion protein, Cu(I)/Ag(I) efflux system [Novosphingobium mathurense]